MHQPLTWNLLKDPNLKTDFLEEINFATYISLIELCYKDVVNPRGNYVYYDPTGLAGLGSYHLLMVTEQNYYTFRFHSMRDLHYFTKAGLDLMHPYYKEYYMKKESRTTDHTDFMQYLIFEKATETDQDLKKLIGRLEGWSCTK